MVEYKLTIDGNYNEFDGFKKTSKYKNLIKQGIKIVFKQKRAFIQHKKEDFKDRLNNKPSSTKKFDKILEELIVQEKNEFLNNLFHTIVCNRSIDEIKDEDIIIMDDE